MASTAAAYCFNQPIIGIQILKNAVSRFAQNAEHPSLAGIDHHKAIQCYKQHKGKQNNRCEERIARRRGVFQNLNP
ncbi:MAG: hypothetical protein AAFO87_04880, partial [Cyanobacteria bacterium J06607_6]